MVNDELIERTLAGCIESLEAIRNEHGSEHLVGFALSTDDSVTTLSACACTSESAARSRNPDARWIPTEWRYVHRSAPLQRATEILDAHYGDAGADGFETHVEASFAALVEALREMRRRGIVGDDVVLVVASTDPDPWLRELAAAGVDAVNPADLAGGWRKAHGF